MEVTMQMLTDSLEQYVKLMTDDYERNRAVHEWAPPCNAVAWNVSKNRIGHVAVRVDAIIGVEAIRDMDIIGESLTETFNLLEKRIELMSAMIIAEPVVSEDRLLAIARGEEPEFKAPMTFEEELKASGLQVTD